MPMDGQYQSGWLPARGTLAAAAQDLVRPRMPTSCPATPTGTGAAGTGSPNMCWPGARPCRCPCRRCAAPEAAAPVPPLGRCSTITAPATATSTAAITSRLAKPPGGRSLPPLMMSSTAA